MPMLNPFSHVNLVPNEELRQFLLHDDIMVRESVAFYLFESWSPDDALIPRVLEGCRRYGEESSFNLLGFARRFRFSTGALLDAVQELERSQPPHVEEGLGRAPLGLIQSHEDLLRTVLSLNTMARIERRRAFAGMSTTGLWRRLTATAHRFDAQGSDREEQHELEDVKEALATRETQPAVLEKVRELDQLPGHCLKTCLIELAGAMRLHEFTRVLVERLGDPDDDELAEAAAASLARLALPASSDRSASSIPTGPGIFVYSPWARSRRSKPRAPRRHCARSSRSKTTPRSRDASSTPCDFISPKKRRHGCAKRSGSVAHGYSTTSSKKPST